MTQDLERDNFGYMLINLTTHSGLHISILTGLLASTVVSYGIFSTQGSYHSLIDNSPMISLHMKSKVHPVVYRSVVYIIWPQPPLQSHLLLLISLRTGPQTCHSLYCSEPPMCSQPQSLFTCCLHCLECLSPNLLTFHTLSLQVFTSGSPLSN